MVRDVLLRDLLSTLTLDNVILKYILILYPSIILLLELLLTQVDIDLVRTFVDNGVIEHLALVNRVLLLDWRNLAALNVRLTAGGDVVGVLHLI